jgi:hypothetical protein
MSEDELKLKYEESKTCINDKNTLSPGNIIISENSSITKHDSDLQANITEISNNLNKNLINDTVNTKDIKLDNTENIDKSKDETEKQESEKRISIKIPGKRKRRSVKVESGNNINDN